MKSNGLAAARFGTMTALALMGFGCGSGDTSSDAGTGDDGQGSADGTQGDSAGGRDGTTDGLQGSLDGGRDGTADGLQGSLDGGEGGPTDGGEGGLALCSPAPADMSACNGNPPCPVSCGLDLSALTTSRPLRTCTCSASTVSAGRWSCPASAGACVYPTDVDLTCLQLPAPLPACSLEAPDGGSDSGTADTGTADSGSADGGSSLIRSGTSTCTLPTSEVCGGVCGSATPAVASYRDSTGAAKAGYCVCVAGVWQCASVSEWPTFGGG
jgi:hypothetical protein